MINRSVAIFTSSIFIYVAQLGASILGQAPANISLAQEITPRTERSADAVPDSASVNGKYSGLLQILNCPQDRSSYGEFRDWGYWGGGSWCGETATAGYWVWVYPNWYVWQYVGQRPISDPPDSASVNGKYSDLLAVVSCPRDRATYGDFYDWGYWSGTSWCGQSVQPGYWVWIDPNWYIWRNVEQPK